MDKQTVTLCILFALCALMHGTYTEQKMCTHTCLLWKQELFVNISNVEGEELHIIILRQKS